MDNNLEKEYYIYFYHSNPDKKSKLHPTELLEKHIKLAELNEEGYSYWGFGSESGLHKLEFYRSREKKRIAFEEIINAQERYRILFFIGKKYDGFDRVYAIADIIDFEEYDEKQFSANPKWQVKNESTGEISKHKYWFKLKNYKIVSTTDNDFNLNKFYYKNSEVTAEENLREKIDGMRGRKATVLMVYKYRLNQGYDNFIKDETLQMEIINCNLNEQENAYYTHQPKAKLLQSKTSEDMSYERDVNVAINALKFANHCCEYSNEHESFNRKKDGLPYMEAHHLIPIKYSDDFEYSLDIEENVVSLCSHCHNQIHYGEEWEPILKVLYEKRKDMLELVGLKITYEKLKQYYE